MLRIHVDTTLFAIPGGPADGTQLAQILQRLLWLSRRQKTHPDTLTRSTDAVEDLLLRNQYPHPSDIKTWIDLCGLSERFDAKSLWNIFNTLLTRIPSVRHELKIEVVQCDVTKIAPAMSIDLLDAPLRPLTENALATVALLDVGPRNFLPALCCAVNDAVGLYSAEFAPIKLFDDKGSGIAAGTTYTLPVLCLDERNDLSRVKPYEVWRRSTSLSMIHLALHLEASSLRKAAGLDPTVSPFFVGAEFAESLAAHQCALEGAYSSVTFETCARVVADIPKYPVLGFAETRLADDAKACRTHITKSHQALRLMAWRRADGIELANVGPKYELAIKHSPPSDAFCDEY